MNTNSIKKSKAEKKQDRLQHSKQIKSNIKMTNKTMEDNILLDIIKENGFIYNIFGSPNGNDCDVAVLITKKFLLDVSGKFERVRDLYKDALTNLIENCDVNIDVNLVIIENGKVVWVRYGTTWETNNAIFYTYHLHDQKYPIFISNAVLPTEIEKNAKIHRAVRNILSIYMRSLYRNEVTKVLHPTYNLNQRINMINKIEMNQNIWAENRKDEFKIGRQLKRACYQTLQAITALETPGLYTKMELLEFRPIMQVFLKRIQPTMSDYHNLQLLFKEFIEIIKIRANKGLIDLNETEL